MQVVTWAFGFALEGLDLAVHPETRVNLPPLCLQHPRSIIDAWHPCVIPETRLVSCLLLLKRSVLLGQV